MSEECLTTILEVSIITSILFLDNVVDKIYPYVLRGLNFGLYVIIL